MASLALGAVGAGIGGMFGFANVGWMIGSTLGKSLDAKDTVIEGQRLSDLSVQSSAPGTPIKRVFGTSRIAGNIIASSGLREHRHEQSQGAKGSSPKQTQISYTYSADVAIGLCEGEIIGIKKVWLDKKLVFNNAADALPSELLSLGANGISNITVYKGTETQEPDPTLESIYGVDNTPAYRGLAYIVIEFSDLAQFGNRIPLVEVEAVEEGAEVGLRHLREVTNDYDSAGITPMAAQIQDNMPHFLLNSQNYDVVSTQHNKTSVRATLDPDGNLIFIEADHDFVVGEDIIPHGVPSEHPDHIGEILRSPNPVYFKFIGKLGGVFEVYQVEANSSYVEYTGGYRNKALYIGTQLIGYIGAAAHENIGTDEIMHVAMSADRSECYVFIKQSGIGDRIEVYKGDGILDRTIAWNSIFDNVNAAEIASMAFETDNPYLWFADSFDDKLKLIAVNNDVFTLEEEVAHSFASDPALCAESGVCFVTTGSRDTDVFTRIKSVSESTVALSDVVTEICAESGLSTSEIDVSELVGVQVNGYTVTTRATARKNIEPLMQAYQFDAADSDWRIKFKLRDASVVSQITSEYLGAHEYNGNTSVENEVLITRTQELELPLQVDVIYASKEGSYQQGHQHSRRLITEATAVESIQLPLVLNDDHAAQLSDILLYEAWTARMQYQFVLPIKYAYLEPADVVEIQRDSGTLSCRLVSTEYSEPGLISCSAIAEDAANYTSSRTGVSTSFDDKISSIPGLTEILFFDFPTLQEQDAGSVVYYSAVKGYLDDWGGASIYKSNDNGSSFDSVKSVDSSAVIGIASNKLEATENWNVFDETSVLTVKLKNDGELSSKSCHPARNLQSGNLS